MAGNPVLKPKAAAIISDERLRDFGSIGATLEECATILGCSVDYIQSHHLAAYKLGLSEMKASLRRKLMMRVDESDACLLFACKVILGMRENTDIADAIRETKLSTVDVIRKVINDPFLRKELNIMLKKENKEIEGLKSELA